MGDNFRAKNDMGEFSEFTLQTLMMKIGTATTFEECGAVGTAEEELESKTVKKNYRGVTVKQRTKGAGSGTIKITGHMNYDMYKKTFGMVDEKLAEGVHAYGQNSTHPTFSMTALVLNEDDRKKLKAYPECTITSNMSRKIENGGDEVAEIDMEIALLPDEYGYCMYEALYDEIDSEIQEKWLTEFSHELIELKSA